MAALPNDLNPVPPRPLTPPLEMRPPVDTDAMMQFAFRVVGDLGAAISGPLLYIGDRMGLFKALAHGNRRTSAQLAAEMGLQERYVREWSAAMVAADYLAYDPATGEYWMAPERAMVLAQEDSPVFCGGMMQMIPDHYAVLPQVARAFREGGGVGYAEYGPDTLEGTERLFRPGYLNYLAQEWIPTMPEVERRLKAGGTVADVGCGRGQALAALARAFPASRFWGFDNFAPNIAYAKQMARREQLNERLHFEERPSDALPQNRDFDLIMTCDSLHDMASPEACARSIAGALAPGGTWFCIEPRLSDRLEENINPVGRLFYAVSTLQCMPCSLATGGAGYGAGMGVGNIRRAAAEAGLSSFTKLPIDNPFNQFFAIRA